VNAAVPQAFEYDPFSQQVMLDPMPFYKVLREQHPVYYIAKYDTYVFSRFQDIVELLSIQDNTFIASDTTLPNPEILLKLNNGVARELPLDPLPIGALLGSPHYENLRQAHIKPLRPKAVAALESYVRKLATQRLDELLPKKRFDLTQDYGGIISASVICHLFGLPESLASQVLQSVNRLSLSDPEKGGIDIAASVQEQSALMLPAIRARRAAGADGSVPLIDGMLHYRNGDRLLTDEEVVLQLICVFIGGTETVPKITAHGLMELANHPEQLASVRADPSRNVPTAVEEMTRYCAPAQWFVRTVHKPVTVAGQKLAPGQRVLALFGSAARDEREFERPDEFIWNRRIARVLSFGFGQHFCIGVHVARLEMRVLVEEFLKRVSGFHFDMEHALRQPSSFQWGWNVLPVVIDREAGQ
jgi:cytochrome P450